MLIKISSILSCSSTTTPDVAKQRIAIVNMAPKSASVNAITERKTSAKSSKRMKQIFAGKVFSFSGDFGENWGHEQMANWIRAHGGRYEKEVSDDTTHLICTMGDYVLKTERGKSQPKLPCTEY